MHRVVALLVVLVGLVVSLRANANSGGLAGYTGKPNAASATGQSCNGCHTGGSAPMVTLTGPASLAAGTSAEYALVVVGDGTTAGGVAATNGVKLTAGAGFRESFGEMVQSAPQGGSGTFKFTVTAPAAGASITLWAVGLGGSSQSNSTSKTITRDVAITGGGAGPVTPGTPATPGASSSSSSGATPGGDDTNAASPGSGSSSGSASSKKTTKKTSDESGDDDDDDDDYRERRAQLDDTQACSTWGAGMKSGGASGLWLAFSVLALVLRRKTGR